MPSVDPNGGGIFAKVLFLQDTPGPKAVGSGVNSLDNPDPTARNMTRTVNEAGFLRSDLLFWNVVPYYVSTLDQNRNGTPAQIRAAIRVDRKGRPTTKVTRLTHLGNRRAAPYQGRYRVLTDVSLGLYREQFSLTRWSITLVI
jgi:hypothetical protein